MMPVSSYGLNMGAPVWVEEHVGAAWGLLQLHGPVHLCWHRHALGNNALAPARFMPVVVSAGGFVWLAGSPHRMHRCCNRGSGLAVDMTGVAVCMTADCSRIMGMH